MTVHLVNLTNPMMMKGPFREVIPVGPHRARIQLPAGTRAGRVQLLYRRQGAGGGACWHGITVTVPSTAGTRGHRD